MSERPERWLSELYRSSAREEPPQALDSAILSAARGEPRGWSSMARGWQAPLAAAAVVVVTVTLVIAVRNDPAYLAQSMDPIVERTDKRSSQISDARTERERADEQQAVGEKTQRADAGSGRAIATAPDLNRHRTADPTLDERMRLSAMLSGKADQAERDVAVPAAVLPSAPPAAQLPHPAIGHREQAAVRAPEPAAPAPAPPGSTDAQAEARQPPPAASRALSSADLPAVPEHPRAPGAPTASAPEKRLAKLGTSTEQKQAPSAVENRPNDLPSRDLSTRENLRRFESADARPAPAAWLENIIKMRNEGRHSEAKESLAAFKRRHPEYPLPAELKDY